MIEGTFCIGVDDEGNRYVGVPHREITLMNGKKIAHYNPCATVKIADLCEVIRLHAEGNIQQVNEILSKSY